jgi:hypothetical protein
MGVPKSETVVGSQESIPFPCSEKQDMKEYKKGSENSVQAAVLQRMLAMAMSLPPLYAATKRSEVK